jgi:antitoxin (DNA-binding transcriptional repressor) of toxin-antitoxin stability system
MATYTVAHAAEHFEEVVAEVEREGEVVLTRDEIPVLRLTTVRREAVAPGAKRRFGALKGKLIVPDDVCESDYTDEDYEAWMHKL